MIKKLFGEIKMTWVKVIIFALATGIYTGIMALLFPSTSSFHDIAVMFEAWILFAIIIIVNCEKPLEAALKTFVFFLISQPLIYLVQVPFNEMGFGLFMYYKYWFMITLLTFPGAFIGWFIKKNNILAGIILSVMLVLLVYMGTGYLNTAIYNFPNHLLSAVYCFAIVPVMIYGIFSDKKAIITASAISMVAAAVFLIMTFGVQHVRMSANIFLDEEKYDINSSWSVSVENEKISSARIEKRFENAERDGLLMDFYEYGENKVTLKDEEGIEHHVIVSYDKDGHIDINEVD